MPGRGTRFAHESLGFGWLAPADHAHSIAVAGEVANVRHWRRKLQQLQEAEEEEEVTAVGVFIYQINEERRDIAFWLLGIVWGRDFFRL